MENLWMEKGWIYLKKDVNTDGTARGYKFGLTKSNSRRSKEYRTENPSIVHLEDYETNDMERAEAEIEWKAKQGDMLLYANSNEWIKPECFDEFMAIWNSVKEEHHIDAPPPVEPEENLFVASPVAGHNRWLSDFAIAVFIGLWFVVKAFFKVTLVVAEVMFAIVLGILSEILKPKRRRRRVW